MAGNADEIPLSLSDDEVDVAPADSSVRETTTSAGPGRVQKDLAAGRKDNDDGEEEEEEEEDEDEQAMRAAMGFSTFGSVPLPKRDGDLTKQQQQQQQQENKNNNNNKRKRENSGNSVAGASSSTTTARGPGQAGPPARHAESHGNSGNRQQQQALFLPSFIEDPWAGLTPKRFADIPQYQRL